MKTTPYSARVTIRVGLGVVAYHGVAFLAAIVLWLYSRSSDPIATASPMLLTSQVIAAAIWWSGSCLAPIFLDCHFQLRHQWLLGLLGSCQPMAAFLGTHLFFHHTLRLSWIDDWPSIALTIALSVYGGVSSFVYLILLKTCTK